MLLGSAFLLGWLNRRVGRQRATAAGLALALVAYAALASVTWTPLLMALTGCISAGMCVASINTGTVRALATPPHYRSRMAGATSFMLSLLLPAAIPLAGQLLQAWPTRQVVALGAGLFGAGAALLVANATSRSLLREPESELVGRYARI
jgi:MFS family permease